MNFNLWIEVLKKPVQTFKKVKKSADLTEGLLNVVVAGVIIGFLNGLMAMAFGTSIAGAFMPVAAGAVGIATFFGVLIGTPIGNAISWIVASAVLYVIAKFLGGKGNFKTQAYLYAIYIAPIGVITAVLNLIPVAGPILSLIVSLYGLYLLTMSLKEAHGFTVGKAVLTWLIPALIVVVIAAIIGAAIATMVLGGLITLPSM